MEKNENPSPPLLNISYMHLRQPSIMVAGNTLPTLTLMVMFWSIRGKAELLNATSIITTEISKREDRRKRAH